MFVVQLLVGLACLCAALWTIGALYYDAGKQTWRGVLLALVWTGSLALAFAMLKPWLAVIVFAISFSCILFWWFGQKPSHDRRWDEC
ncbi:MAG: hypothetical protein ACR2NP_07190, partial [Pirellulaceae bacterium]